MSDQSKLGLGQIITTEQQRDAIHIAVAPVVAGEPLKPGQHIGVLPNGEAVSSNGVDPTIGIVDPFLKTVVKSGQRFWIYLYPGSIKSLRHVWTHPSFQDKEETSGSLEVSEQWIQAFAYGVGIPYEDIMSAADSVVNSGMYELDTTCEVPSEFWTHYEVVRGVKVAPRDRTNYFSCSC
jgi:hypothetical protein